MSNLPTKKTKINLAISSLVLLIVLGSFGLSMRYIDKIRSEIIVKQGDLELEQLVSYGLQDTKQTLIDLDSQISEFNQFFISNERRIAFLGEIEAIAQSKNVSIELNLIPEPLIVDEETARLAVLEIRINTEGEFNDIISFYRQLALKKEYINIKEFTIERDFSGDRRDPGVGELVDTIPRWRSQSTVHLYQITD